MMTCNSWDAEYEEGTYLKELYIDWYEQQKADDEYSFSVAQKYLDERYKNGCLLSYGHQVKLGRMLRAKKEIEAKEINKNLFV